MQQQHNVNELKKYGFFVIFEDFLKFFAKDTFWIYYVFVFKTKTKNKHFCC